METVDLGRHKVCSLQTNTNFLFKHKKLAFLFSSYFFYQTSKKLLRKRKQTISFNMIIALMCNRRYRWKPFSPAEIWNIRAVLPMFLHILKLYLITETVNIRPLIILVMGWLERIIRKIFNIEVQHPNAKIYLLLILITILFCRNKALWDQVLEKEIYSRTDLLDQVGFEVDHFLRIFRKSVCSTKTQNTKRTIKFTT